jgi:nitrite reductase/ring-hydroxylating ferredoxin subunit
MSEAKTPQSRARRRYVVARTDEIAEGGRLIVEAGGREIGIYRVRGKFYALLNRCPHLGGPLCQGQVVTEVTASVPGEVRGNPDRVFATCPWHNWEFDIATGQSYWNPKGLRARPFPVDVEMGEAVQDAMATGDAERIRGPYSAETVPIAVEDEYLVLSLRPAQRSVAAKTPCAPAARAVAEENA